MESGERLFVNARCFSIAPHRHAAIADGEVRRRQRKRPGPRVMHLLSLELQRSSQLNHVRGFTPHPMIDRSSRTSHRECCARNVKFARGIELVPLPVDQSLGRRILRPLRPVRIGRPRDADRRFPKGHELHQMLAKPDSVPTVRIPDPAIGGEIWIGWIRVGVPLEYGDAVLLADMPSETVQHLDTAAGVLFAQANGRNQLRIRRAIFLRRQPCIETPFARLQVRVPFSAVNNQNVMAMSVVLACAARLHTGPPRRLIGKRIDQTGLAEKVIEVLFRPATINSQPTMTRIRIRAHLRLRHGRGAPQ